MNIIIRKSSLMKSSTIIKVMGSLSLLFLSITISIACSCVWPFPTPQHFCRSVNENSNIILAEVVEKPEWFAMEVKVIEDINLETGTDTITVLGQDGFNCGEWLEDFLVGDTLVLAVSNGEYFEVSTNQTYHWFLNICGLHYLRYSNGIVTGDIDFDESSISYEEFSEDIMNCIDLSSSTDEYLSEGDLIISPNPAFDYIDLYFENFQSVDYLFDIVDISGQVIKSNVKVDAPISRVELNDMNPGVYFLRSKNSEKLITKKFIKI